MADEAAPRAAGVIHSLAPVAYYLRRTSSAKKWKQPAPAAFAEMLAGVYTSEGPAYGAVGADNLGSIPLIQVAELQAALKQLKRGKGSDRHGLIMEMFQDGGVTLHTYLTTIFNNMLREGDFPPDWRTLMFIMLPKAGDTSKPSNWRPIAVLDITYKIFAKVIHNRIRESLERHQPAEQFGFRQGRGADDALFLVECVVSRAVEWKSSVWIMSIDLTKAFDRVEYSALFKALEQQGVDA